MTQRLLEVAPCEAMLRRARMEDMPDVAKIHRLAFFTAMPHMPVLHNPEEDLNFYTTGVFTSSEIWVAEFTDVVAGFIAFRDGLVEQLYVVPKSQRLGIGSSLLSLAKSMSDSLQVWTFQCNEGARHFYEKHGFRAVQETNGARNEERQPDMLYFWERGDISTEASSAPR
ncbi:MAG TPA: GNAT family N-acetyltransferase [Chthoniobacter sp.]|nr:GNAT family N-acetyltransferase [Chthoniobacter sp.]